MPMTEPACPGQEQRHLYQLAQPTVCLSDVVKACLSGMDSGTKEHGPREL